MEISQGPSVILRTIREALQSIVTSEWRIAFGHKLHYPYPKMDLVSENL